MWDWLNWEWFVTWPLKVIAIIVGGLIVLAVLRRIIRILTERIATGYYRAYADALDEHLDDGEGASVAAAAAGVDTEVIARIKPRRKSVLARDSLVKVDEALGGVPQTSFAPETQARRAQRARTVGSVLTSAANIVVGVTMVVMILSVVGATEIIGPFLASAGIVGIVIGFGAQSLVRDFISGIFILIEDQYGVGDGVDLGFGVTGTVEKMDLRLTHVRAFDGTLWHVRNGEILRAGNKTQQWSRAVADIRVPAGTDRDATRAALGRAADRVMSDLEFTPYLLGTPSVRGIDKLTDDHYHYTVHVKVRPGKDGEVNRAILRAAQEELVEAGIIGSESS
ncbi:MAG: mechanosensitive ion channel family protein [Promicromonosporaceae bacterium]|nr:mechanosensitive ion channel family protein [Promicromonosporaceae bacterium]